MNTGRCALTWLPAVALCGCAGRMVKMKIFLGEEQGKQDINPLKDLK
jgi:hypothetical protein